jgi:small subunit ribosomal protein S16
MLAIKFSRKGTKKKPVYRVIVTEKARDPWGKYLENLGIYNPHTKVAQLKADRIQYWISQGAQPTATVNNLLITQGVTKGEKVRASKSKPGKKKAAVIAQQKAEADAKRKAEIEAKKKAEEEAKAAAEAAQAPEAPAPTEEAKTE